MNPITMITAIAKAAAAYFGWAKDRQTLNNSAAMQERQEKSNEVQTVDQVNQAIAKKDVAAIQKELSE